MKFWETKAAAFVRHALNRLGDLNETACDHIGRSLSYVLRRWGITGVVVFCMLVGGGIVAGDRALLFRATFIAKGTGAAERDAMSKLRDVVSVKDFGCVGDGVTDDSTCVANALTASGANQVIDFSCPGNYKTTLYGTLACGDYYPPMTGATGAYPRSLPTKILDIVDVKDFGAKGDGVTNDSTAIQNAIDAIKAGSLGAGTVYFPTGTYIANNIQWKSGIELNGAGPNATILKSNSATPLLKLINGATGEHHGAIQHLTLDGNSVGTYGLQLTLVARFVLFDLRIQNFTTAGIILSGTLIFSASNVEILSSVTGIVAAGNGVTYPNLIHFTDCRFQGNTANAVDWSDGSMVVFENSEFGSNGTSGNAATGTIKFGNADVAGEGVGLVVKNSWFENNSGHSAIRVNAPATALTRAIIEDTHIIGGTRTYGLYVTGANNAVQATNLFAQNAGTADIFIDTNVLGFLDRCISGTHTFNGTVTALPIPDSTTRMDWDSVNGDYRFKVNGTPFLTVSSTNTTVAGSFSSGRAVITYSAAMATDSAIANSFSITATNGTAFTINNPSNAITGKRILYTIRNGSGGALGAITWGALFKINATAIAPANATSRSVEFLYDGTNWVELWRGALDVPN